MTISARFKKASARSGKTFAYALVRMAVIQEGASEEDKSEPLVGNDSVTRREANSQGSL